MTLVRLEKITQTFGGREVLCGLDLAISSGEYVVLLGKSGCGKTTTLRIIAGLQSPDRGDVFFDQRRVSQIAPHQRDVSMVFQNDGLYPHLTVGESIRFALKGRVRSAELNSRVDQAVGLTHIESILDRKPSRLSGGELRRAAVAKAIAQRSSVRLLDEPLSALDVPVRHELQEDILRWHATVPGTSIHVTHDGQEAMRMADKIAVMEAGRIAQMATPHEVYTRPQTISVAKAIGSPPMNFFPASLVDGRIEFRDSAISGRVGLKLTGPNRDVIVGVRPEAFRIAPPKEAAQGDVPSLVVSGPVTRFQRVLSDTHVFVDAGTISVAAIMPAASGRAQSGWAQSAEAAGVSEGTIAITCPASDVHLFDAESGVRIETKSDG